ncbi:MAG: putative DNA binding domain-containing protein [Clostridia bacterium]|nr:putative DNA binding domain-containing protein [Clostridia bacterium]
MKFESENTEFKLQATDDLYKEIIAFANTDGGIVYIGIDNEENAVGLENVDKEYTRITNGIRDAIMPDVTMFVKYTLQDNGVVKIAVGEGSYKPYYLKSKGLKPGGVYVRQGTSSVPASSEKIRQMIKESDGDTFEEIRSLEQNLSFDCAQVIFNRYKVDFTKEKYRALGITDNSGDMYTNLALIISDQCRHTIKVAVFADEANTEFRDSREFCGSVFRQLDDTFNYLKLCNKTQATFKGLERIERQDYPDEAVREALLNAIVHRDYGFSGSIIINVNDREIEFISLGGLLPGLSTDDILSGISQPRNKKLAEIFYRLRLIESYGMGIRKIFNLYKDCAVLPRIEVTQNTFKIILPNMNNIISADKPVTEKLHLTAQKRKILEAAEYRGEITEADIKALLDVKDTRAYILMREMCDMGLMKQIGRGAEKKYVINY